MRRYIYRFIRRPFAGLYQYSSDDRDMSNCIDHDEFFEHYGYCIEQLARVTMPGRISAVHCMDIPLSNAGCDAMFDLPGRIIREHESRGGSFDSDFAWFARLEVKR